MQATISIPGNLHAIGAKSITDFDFIKGILRLHMTHHNNFVSLGQQERGNKDKK
jgi:hypothetical protein